MLPLASQPVECDQGSRPDDWIELIQILSVSARHMRRLLGEVLSNTELAETELQLLWLCLRASPAGLVQSELAARVGTSKAQTSALVESLRRRGLLTCYRTPEDRRRQIWRITDVGQETAERLHGRLLSMYEAWGDSFSGAERHELVSLLGRVLTLRPISTADPPCQIGDGSLHDKPQRGAA